MWRHRTTCRWRDCARAGAVIVGKTNTPELALAGYTDNRLFGATGNPWAPTLTPGGSSGGAVAGVSAGFGPLAVATDAGDRSVVHPDIREWRA